MKFRSTCIYKRQDNIKVAHSIIRSGLLNHQIYDLRFTLSTTFQFMTMATAQIIHCIACKEPVRLINRAFNAMAVSVGTIEYVKLVYPLRCTVQQFEKGLRSSGAASSANIPMLTAPWRTSLCPASRGNRLRGFSRWARPAATTVS